MWAPVEGRYGRTRDGRKVGPIVPSGRGDLWPWEARGSSEAPGIGVPLWTATGSYFPNGDAHPLDLVAEWVDDGPVRTVTRQEIVPGTYGAVTVGRSFNVPDCGNPDIPDVATVEVHIEDHLTADELDAAAHVLTKLAEALRNG